MTKRPSQQLVVQQASVSHSGPLPTPQDFAGYNQILPGAAERILRMAEIEQAHRHEQEERIVTAAIRAGYIGQGIAGTLGITVCSGGIWAILHGQALGGAAAVVAALASSVVAFLHGQKKEDPPPPKP